MASYPVPTGVTASFANVRTDSVATATFTFNDPGMVVLTFQPVDLNDPGVATLYNNTSGDVVLTMNRAGYETHFVPLGGQTYYWTATKGANILAMTKPSVGW